MKSKTIHNIIGSLVFFSILLSACQGLSPAAGGKGASGVNQETLVAEAAYQTLTALPPVQETVVPLTTQAVSTQAPTPRPTEPAATEAPTATATPIPQPVGPTGFPANVNPLTGLVVSDPKVLDRRPVLVKVSNFPAIGRPHAGLSSADIVFEYFIGAGTNRFVGLFYGQNAPKVGPIRSGRLVDAQIVPMYQGVLAYSGAYITVLKTINNALGNRAIASSPSTCPAVCDDGRQTVISQFADTAKVTEYAQANAADPKTRPNLDGMRFEPAAPASAGKDATQVAIQYNAFNRGEWRYDPASGRYLRWIENTDANNAITMIPLTDRNTEKQLAFSNVVVLTAFYTEFAATLHDINLAANAQGGKATLFRDGKAIEATWKSQGAAKPLAFFGADGKPLPFKPGNTWIAIMGVNSQIVETAGKWEVQFYLP